jgi:hypothetical protein
LEIFISDPASASEYKGNLYVGTLNEIIGTEVWEYDGITWTQVNTDGFGDVHNEKSSSMTVYNGELYVGTENWKWGGTGAEVWETVCQTQEAVKGNPIYGKTQKPVDTNKPIMPLASYRISQAKKLLDEVQNTCGTLKDDGNRLYAGCCKDTLGKVIELIEIAEGFYVGENYIAADNFALEALELLQQIQVCCGK